MNKREFYLRNARLEDLDEIMNVESQSFGTHIQEEKSLFKKRIETFGRGFLVFEADQNERRKIAGYFCTELWEKIPKGAEDFLVGHDIKKIHTEHGKILYISSFALLPEFRGNGNGKKLFEQSLDFFKTKFNFEKILLLVNEKWIGAKKIYASYGFKEIFICKDIFLNDEKNSESKVFTSDGIVMLLDLTV